MPVAEAGFVDDDGRPLHGRLLEFGPTIQVTVGLMTEGEETPPPRFAHALVDTGASDSCIDTQLAQELDLPIVDVEMISGVGGPQEHFVYAARVDIPSLEFLQFGRFAGVNLAAGGMEHRVLLGRTFLQNTVMIYDGLRAQITLAAMRLPE